MGLKIKILAFLIGALFLLFIFRSIKRKNMRPAFAVLWMAVSLFLVSVPIFESFYQWLAGSVIGIVDARHVIYIVLIGFLLVYLFYLTQKINQMADRIQVLLAHTAILEAEIRKKLSS